MPDARGIESSAWRIPRFAPTTKSAGFSDEFVMSALVSLGFCCFLVWTHIYALPLDNVSLREAGGVLSESLILRNVGELATLALVIFLQVRRIAFPRKTALWVSLATGIAALGTVFTSGAASVVLSFFTGCGTAFLLASWCAHFATMDKTRVVLCLLPAVILNALVVFLVSSCHRNILDECSACLFVLSGVCLYATQDFSMLSRHKPADWAQAKRRIPWPFLAVCWIGFAGICFIHGSMLRMNIPIFSRWYVAIAGSCILVILLVVQLFSKQSKDASELTITIITLEAICLAFLLASGEPSPLSLLIVHAVKDSLMTLWVLCIAFIIKENGLSPLLAAAVGSLVCDSYPPSVSSTLFIPVFPAIRVPLLIVLLSLCVVTIIISFMRHVSHAELATEEPEVPQQKEASSPSSRISQLGEEYGLSEREIEVLLLSVKGFSIQATAERLQLSPNTVKAHLKHIENKVGVLTKKELIEFVFSQKRSTDTADDDGQPR